MPFADIVEETICKETDLLEIVIPRKVEMMYRVAKIPCDSFKHSRSSCFRFGKH
jgi:hypothetical protein